MGNETTKDLGRRELLGATLGAGVVATTMSISPVAAQAKSKRKAHPVVKQDLYRGYANGPFGQIHYRDTGEGRPLVLFHQSPMSSQQYTAVYPLFKARGYRAIGIDTPGFGGSTVTPFEPKVEDWAKIYEAVLDHLNIDIADVAGHHTGSTVATQATLQYPDRVRKLVIHSALLVSDEERAARLKKVQEGEKNHGHPYNADGSHLSNRFQSVAKRYGPGFDPKVITRFVTEEYTNTGPGWYGHNAAYVYNHGEALKKIKHPAMIMNNTGDMIYELTKRISTIRPDFIYVELSGGGVDIIDQQPENWSNTVINFLNK